MPGGQQVVEPCGSARAPWPDVAETAFAALGHGGKASTCARGEAGDRALRRRPRRCVSVGQRIPAPAQAAFVEARP
ncbi:hypothetical protein P4123_28800 [Pseudomonas aeruginosa]|nr:hypothetical protein [Pseudomonas aeruginosa]